MRAVIQRVKSADISVDGNVLAKINQGLLVFVGIGPDDKEEDVQYLSKKISALRVFEDDQGKMNLDLQAVDGSLLCISQFTLYGTCHQGNRPSFIGAAPPKMGKEFYQMLLEELKLKLPGKVYQGEFGADMKINALNDGPVTLLIDSKRLF